MLTYFVHNIYCDYYNAKKSQKALEQFAAREYTYSLIPEDRLEAVADRLRQAQEAYLKENQRMRPVEISVSKPYNDGYRTIHIGTSSIQMIAVRKVIG